MPLEYPKESASQTAGPYLHIGMYPSAAGLDVRTGETPSVLVSPATQGERIRIEGHIYDGAGSRVRDAQVELWQANAAGRYNHPADRQDKPLDADFKGWGRAVCDFETGLYWFETVKPGGVIGRHGREMAPHVNLWIVARGINVGLHTRVYFSDEAQANAEDPVLKLVDHAPRRETLIAQRQDAGDRVVYRFDISLQGDNESVFFDT